jgi:hypothetical protein
MVQRRCRHSERRAAAKRVARVAEGGHVSVPRGLGTYVALRITPEAWSLELRANAVIGWQVEGAVIGRGTGGFTEAGAVGSFAPDSLA